MAIALETRSSVAQFYRGTGRALMDHRNFPLAIGRHLEDERAVLRGVVCRGGYTAAVEVGCADGGMHVNTLLELRLAYVGIDVVPEFVSKLSRRLKASNARPAPSARVLDACRLSRLAPALRHHKALVVFSFNSFGNLADPHAVLAETAALRSDALILTYRTGACSSRTRGDYYARCHLERMRQITDSRGVVFQSVDGLCSYAYRPQWVRSLVRGHGFTCIAEDFGVLGRFFWCSAKKRKG